MDASLRRFSIFYFCYYAALGAYTPYVGRWVDALGHGGYVVGGMLGLWYGTRILAPPAWAALTGRSARRQPDGHSDDQARAAALRRAAVFNLRFGRRAAVAYSERSDGSRICQLQRRFALKCEIQDSKSNKRASSVDMR
mgnify:CR=1 FL=1